jgi:hypothetical protein
MNSFSSTKRSNATFLHSNLYLLFTVLQAQEGKETSQTTQEKDRPEKRYE